MTIYPLMLVVVVRTTPTRNQRETHTNVADVDRLISPEESAVTRLNSNHNTRTRLIVAAAVYTETDSATVDNVAIGKLGHRTSDTEIVAPDHTNAASYHIQPG